MWNKIKSKIDIKLKKDRKFFHFLNSLLIYYYMNSFIISFILNRLSYGRIDFENQIEMIMFSGRNRGKGL